MANEVRYARNGDAHIAYQVRGTGARDVIVITAGFIPIDTMANERRTARAMARLEEFVRLIRFDRRGIGLSDPVSPSEPPTIEQWTGDALVVLDAVGSPSVAVLAEAEATPIALMLAAAHPERVDALLLVNGFPRVIRDDDFPMGLPREEVESIIDALTDPFASSSDVDWISQYV